MDARMAAALAARASELDDAGFEPVGLSWLPGGDMQMTSGEDGGEEGMTAVDYEQAVKQSVASLSVQCWAHPAKVAVDWICLGPRTHFFPFIDVVPGIIALLGSTDKVAARDLRLSLVCIPRSRHAHASQDFVMPAAMWWSACGTVWVWVGVNPLAITDDVKDIVAANGVSTEPNRPRARQTRQSHATSP